MRLILQTVFKNVDREWLDWWLKSAGPTYGIRADNIEPGEEFTHKVESKDPTSAVVGTTVITLEVPK